MDDVASVPYEIGLHSRLRDDEFAVVFLDSVFNEEETRYFLMGLGDIANARVGGLGVLSEHTGLNQKQLSKAFTGSLAEKRHARKRIRCALGLGFSKDHSVPGQTASGQR